MTIYASETDRKKWSCGLFCGLTDLEQTDRDPVIEKLGALSVVLDRGYWGRGEMWCLILSIILPYFQFCVELVRTSVR